MINIESPQLRTTKDTTRITSRYGKSKEEVLWFEIHEQYLEFIAPKRLDAFVVGLLLHAMSAGDDINVNGEMSQKLHYQLNNYLIPAIALSNPKLKKMKIHCNSLTSENINVSGAVATGFSGGVDSFATIAEHSSLFNCATDFKITHFTFFNVGSNGDSGGDKARELFEKRFSNLKTFPEEVNKEFVKVDSNISEILNMDFKSSCTLRSMSPVLLLQKLFKIYYHSSSYRFDTYKLDKNGMDYFDLLNLQMLSTESVSVYSTGSQYSRIEKTKLISDFEPSHRYLNVCVYELENCSECYKCMRTLLTLELQGNIMKYSEIFNLEKYHRAKPRFISRILVDRKKDPFAQELCLELRKAKHKILPISYLHFMKNKLIQLKNRAISN